MNIGVITFDFHNTLVRCDSWFDLETRTLPAAVLAYLDLHSDELGALVTSHYRSMRQEVVASGRELDALAGTMEALRRSDIAVDQVAVRTAIEALFQPLVALSSLVPGAGETVSALSDEGHVLAVISSAVHHDFLLWSLDALKLRNYFQVVVTSASAGWYKSVPAIYEHTLASLQAEPARAVHVGDSFRFDHLSARAVGMASVWLSEDKTPPDPLAPEPDLIVDTLVGSAAAIHSLALSR